MSSAANIKSPVIGPIPDWDGLVDQRTATTMAEFISSFPVARTVTFGEQSRILNEAVVCAMPANAIFSVALTAGGFVVAPSGENQRFSCLYGTHTVHGRFAALWSVLGRGPETLPRPRPCFLFCDEVGSFLKAA